jgi:hypothetical protein
MPFKKGDSNINRKGRPKKGDSMTEDIQKQLDLLDVDTSGDKKITRREAISKVLTNMAIKGDMRAIKLVLEYTTSRPATDMNISGDGLVLPEITILTGQDVRK